MWSSAKKALGKWTCILATILGVQGLANGAVQKSDVLLALRGGPITPDVIKSASTDGTNYLAAFSTSEGKVGYLQIDRTNPVPSLPPIVLKASGTSPKLAFGGAWHLMAWADTNTETIVGQLIALNGQAAGPCFPIVTNVHASEVSAVAFSGTRFWVIWEESGRIQGRSLVPGTTDFVEPTPLSSPGRISKVPRAASGTTNALAVWETETTTPGLWEVQACALHNDGSVGQPVTVSDVAAQVLDAPGVAFDGIHYLAVWAREEGPFVRVDPVTQVPTNVFYPWIHARLLSPNGAPVRPEMVVSKAAGKQANPLVTYDGCAFVVAWEDWRDAKFGATWTWLQQISRTGERLHYEAGRHAKGATAITGAGGQVLLLSWTSLFPQTVSLFLGRDSITVPVLSQLKFTAQGHMDVTCVGDVGRPYLIQTSSDLLHWQVLYYDGIPVLRWPGRTSDMPIIPPPGPKCFFRAIYVKTDCLGNLRKIHSAKYQWALDHAKTYDDQVSDADIFGSGKYIETPPECPVGGSYTLGNVRERPTCLISGHTL